MSSRYSGLDDWTKKSFSKSVHTSDEALVLLVIKHYIPKWELEVELGGMADDASSKRGGAKKGDKSTCVKQKACYYEYCMKVQQARRSTFNEAWDNKLKVVACNRMREQEEKSKLQEAENSNIDGTIGNGTADQANTSNDAFIYGFFEDGDMEQQAEV
jgi:hypothetical protein